MFLGSFTPKEQRAFLGLAHRMILADAVEAPEEIALWNAMLDEMGLAVGLELDDSDTTEKLCAEVSRRTVQVFCLLELAALAFVEHDYAPEERALLSEVAGFWDVPDDVLPEIEQWAHQRIKVAEDAVGILGRVLSDGSGSGGG